ncbi:type VI secretion system tip protein VgrG [Salmonella enterica subsp. enterica]|nr:type VI secretion system tip protein VgrG [Salmonella enterica subsp. enterica]
MNALFFDHRHHKLTIRGLSAVPDVLSFEGHEYLSQPFCYDIRFTSTDKAIAPESVLMQDSAFSLCAPPVPGMPVQMPQRTLHGVITAFKQLSVSRDEACYEVRLEPRLALLARSYQNAIYQDMSVQQIVEKILRERHGMRGQDFVFTLNHEYPRREQVMQYGEDDLTFIQRLLSEPGIWYRFTADTRLKIEVAEFYDDQRGYEQGMSLPLRHPSGMHDGAVEAVWGLNSTHRVVEKSVATRDYNYRDAQADMNSTRDVTAGDKTTYGEAYHWADDFLKAGEKNTPESGAFYARIRHERYLNDQAQLHGSSNSVQLTPGQELKVTGGEAPEVFAKGVVITAIHTRAGRDRSYELSFTAIPYSERYGFRAVLPAKPVMAGTLPARVTSTRPGDIYGHIDKDGRYRVNLLFDRDSWPAGYESLWVRQARQYAGDTYGFHLPLLAGTEVAIAFENGDPDRPYIAHALHDSAHPDHVTIRNYKRNVLRTPANNKIRLEDARGQEHIKVSTEYGGKSQLNLGHLVDKARKQRGEGFELRTDKWGAIRAGQGIFISADGQLKAQGQSLDMKPAVSQLKSAQEQMQALSDDAQTAKANASDLQMQIDLLQQKLSDLQQSVILMSAPQGVGISSNDHIQISASGNLIATAGNNADIGVVRNFFIGVGNALSVFVRKLGIKFIANQGPISVQAQNDLLELLAKKEISISSTEDEIKIIAKKKITINGGGSYIVLDENTIESGTAGDYLVKVGHYSRETRNNQEMPIIPLPDVLIRTANLTLNFFDQDNQPIAGSAYTITFSGGSVLQGILDENGYALHKNVPDEDAQVVYQLPEALPDNPWPPYSDLIQATDSSFMR